MMIQQKRSKEELLAAVRFHPFFQGVEQDTALSLIEECEDRLYEKNEVIFHADTPRKGLLLILDGIAEVYVTKEGHDRHEVLEVVQKNELIGFSSLADFLGVSKQGVKNESMVEVKAVEVVDALHIPFDVVSKRWDDSNVHDYLLSQVAIRLKDIYGSLAEQVKLAKDFGEKDAFVIRVQDMMHENVISVESDTTIQRTANVMMKNRTSSVLVIDDGVLQGIVTERDMVARVIAIGRNLNEPITSIMTSKPYTISRFAYYYDALSMVILNGIKHLPVVENGEVVGVITLSDLLRKKNEGMMKAIQKIEHADEETLAQVKQGIYEVLDTLLNDHVPILNTLDIITKLYDRLLNRSIELSIEALKVQGLEPPCAFGFYQMGSGGRGEQFMLTDQDHFLVYENDDKATRNYFEKLAQEIVSHLEAAGYARCKGLMMASEPRWRGSLKVWQDRLREWTIQSTNDNLLLAQNFFSYRLLFGDEKLHIQFEETITELLSRSKIFLFRLTQIEKEHQIPTLDTPIRSLFKLERKTIDMKKEILFPYHHSLQILSLINGVVSGTPMERLEKLVAKGVLSESFTADMKESINTILTLYVRQRWTQAKKGEEMTSVLHFPKLTTREKEELMLSLKTLRELQGKVFMHFSM